MLQKPERPAKKIGELSPDRYYDGPNDVGILPRAAYQAHMPAPEIACVRDGDGWTLIGTKEYESKMIELASPCEVYRIEW
jgi:hypothetical protein